VTLRVFDVDETSGFHPARLDDIQIEPDGAALWIDVINPTQAELEELGRTFGFHPLAVEDARKRHQRPKVDEYQDHLFIVIYALDPPGDAAERPAMQELAMFVMKHAVLTVRWQEIDELEVAAHRWRDRARDDQVDDPAMLLYTIVDSIVDGYFPCIDDIGDRIEDLEEAMFNGTDPDTLQHIFRMKRLLLEMRRAVAPSRDVFNALLRRELPLLGPNSLAYFQDVYDHVIRVTDSIDAYRDILSSVVDIHLSLVSNNLNKTVQKLTSASIVLMSLALVAGIYGMNFEHMPELGWRYGYVAALGLMAALGISLFMLFRRLGWW
jgi:magnesium transporter